MKRLVWQVMTTNVVVVRDSAPFKEIVELLQENDVSAVPVVDATNVVLGVISEADLLLKEEALNGARPFLQSPRRRREKVKAEAYVAAELMTRPAVTVPPFAPVAEAARVMHRRGVKRLPVVDHRGRLVGIVSRGDLLTVFLQSDEDIREEVAEEALQHQAGLDAEQIRVSVRHGVVALQGRVDQRSMRELAGALAASVEGVVGVDNRLGWRVDDISPVRYEHWGPVG